MVTIDGSHGEGGGQILRSALTLAALTGTPLRVERIRAGREQPGLRPQHLTAVRAAAALCAAGLQGAAIGSTALTFVPQRPVQAGEYTFDVTEAADGGSAGAVTLILQTVLLPLALAAGPSRVTLRGGTDVPWSPPSFYVERVYLPTLARLGVTARMTVRRWGFYPRGGGELTVEIEGGARLHGADLGERGALVEVEVIAYVAQLPSHIPQRMGDRARSLLQALAVPVRVEPRHVPAASPGAALFLLARYEKALAGFAALGRQGLPSEAVAEAAGRDLLAHHATGAAVDPHLADQLVLPFVLADGPARATTSQVTRHLLTNTWTAGHFPLPAAHTEGSEGQPGWLSVPGPSVPGA